MAPGRDWTPLNVVDGAPVASHTEEYLPGDLGFLVLTVQVRLNKLGHFGRHTERGWGAPGTGTRGLHVFTLARFRA